jgi:hypothetical protein
MAGLNIQIRPARVNTQRRADRAIQLLDDARYRRPICSRRLWPLAAGLK